MDSDSFSSFSANRVAGGAAPNSLRVIGADTRTRVLVVDDSYFMQRRLTEIIQSAPDLRVIGCADNGAEAIRLAERLSPDVITMDINMAKFDGLHAIDYIMRSNPRPIVIISSYTQKGSRAALYGLEMGVIDIVEKPSSGGVALDIMERASEIITKVRTAARVRVVRTLRGGFQDAPIAKPAPITDVKSASVSVDVIGAPPVFDFPDGVPQVIAIGASTGGPLALQELLRGMPYEFFPPIVVVQHLPEKFTREFASQLDAISSLEINEAENGQPIKRGQVYIAPGGFHLQVDTQGCLVINDGPPVNHCRPSVDVLFHSLAKHYGPHVLAMVLTGMGEDGAVGSMAIKRAGGSVLVQDEASCVVFGMPAAAIRAGGVDRVLPLEGLKQALIRLGEKAAGPSSRRNVQSTPVSKP
jgi:two-component system, chemotaxis family, protein-glutamate methylesterase/glutaminase